MTGPHSDDDLDVPAWILSAARAIGLSEVRVRWKLMRTYRQWLSLRREFVPRSHGYQHQTCSACGALQDGGVSTCASCGASMGSPVTKVMRSLGLSIPAALSVSSLLGVAMVTVYARMLLARPGQGTLSWTHETLIAFGATYAPALQAGQFWRLTTAVFLHIGLWHLGFNLIALTQIGPSIEEVFGRGRMLFLFILTGAVANVASVFLNGDAVSAGASGALMGLIGVAAGWGHRLGTTHGRDVRNQMLKWGAYTMVFGIFIGADDAAHAAGFIAGALMGIAFRPETLQHTRASRASVGMGALGTLATAVTVALALFPPATSPVFAQSVNDEREPAADTEVEEADMQPYFSAWTRACELRSQGKTPEAFAQLGLHAVEGRAWGVNRSQVLDGYCEALADLRERCQRFEATGDPATFYERVSLLPGQRAAATEAVRSRCQLAGGRVPSGAASASAAGASNAANRRTPAAAP